MKNRPIGGATTSVCWVEVNTTADIFRVSVVTKSEKLPAAGMELSKS